MRTLKVKVKPGASRSEVLGKRGEFLKVAVSAPAKKGKANKELLAFLKKEKGWSCRILRGLRSSKKLLEIR